MKPPTLYNIKPRQIYFKARTQTQGNKLSPGGVFYLLGGKGKSVDDKSEWLGLGALYRAVDEHIYHCFRV